MAQFVAEILPDFVIREHFFCLTISHFFMYGLVHFCWPLKNLLVLIYSKLHSKSCDNLYNSTWFLIYIGLLVSYIFIVRLKVELPFSSDSTVAQRYHDNFLSTHDNFLPIYDNFLSTDDNFLSIYDNLLSAMTIFHP